MQLDVYTTHDGKYSLSFSEEIILIQQSEGEINETKQCHCENISTNHWPAERLFKFRQTFVMKKNKVYKIQKDNFNPFSLDTVQYPNVDVGLGTAQISHA